MNHDKGGEEIKTNYIQFHGLNEILTSHAFGRSVWPQL
jgi:hypothetical protein